MVGGVKIDAAHTVGAAQRRLKGPLNALLSDEILAGVALVLAEVSLQLVGKDRPDPADNVRRQSAVPVGALGGFGHFHSRQGVDDLPQVDGGFERDVLGKGVAG